MPKTVYLCEGCRELYDTQLEAQLCEMRHQEDTNHPDHKNREMLLAIVRSGNCPCFFCGHSYYVYGIEQNCDCEKLCQEYSHFKYAK